MSRIYAADQWFITLDLWILATLRVKYTSNKCLTFLKVPNSDIAQEYWTGNHRIPECYKSSLLTGMVTLMNTDIDLG